jgi:hypothetical protein
MLYLNEEMEINYRIGIYIARVNIICSKNTLAVLNKGEQLQSWMRPSSDYCIAGVSFQANSVWCR